MRIFRRGKEEDAEIFIRSIDRLDAQIERTFGLNRPQAATLRGVMKTIEHADEDGFMGAEDRMHAINLIRDLNRSGVSDETIRKAVGSGNLSKYDIELQKN